MRYKNFDNGASEEPILSQDEKLKILRDICKGSIGKTSHDARFENYINLIDKALKSDEKSEKNATIKVIEFFLEKIGYEFKSRKSRVARKSARNSRVTRKSVRKSRVARKSVRKSRVARKSGRKSRVTRKSVRKSKK